MYNFVGPERIYIFNVPQAVVAWIAQTIRKIFLVMCEGLTSVLLPERTTEATFSVSGSSLVRGLTPPLCPSSPMFRLFSVPPPFCPASSLSFLPYVPPPFCSGLPAQFKGGSGSTNSWLSRQIECGGKKA